MTVMHNLNFTGNADSCYIESESWKKEGHRRMRFSELLKTKKNFVFIGETGSGKSEIALNTAAMLQRQGDRTVHLFDLDQTKAMFRARDAEAEMSAIGVTLHYMPQLLDTPVLVNGIIPHLIRKDSVSVLDVGGNENAARMVGCLSDYLNRENTAAVYVINPYRPWSATREDIDATRRTVVNACHLESLWYVANPTVGPETDEADILEGLSRLSEELAAVFVKEDCYPRLKDVIRVESYPLHRYLRYPWT